MSAAIPLNHLLNPEEAKILKFERPCSLPEFCERSVYVPKSLAPGPFRHSTIPLLYEILSKIGSKERQFNTLVGPKQTGKTVAGIVSPVLYFWLELGEDAVLGYPTREMAKAGYKTKILPSIKSNKELYEKLPTTGTGSKGGIPSEIETKSGSILYILGAGGGDIQMSSVTAKNVFLDEVEKMQSQKASSSEGSPIDQMISRADAFQLDRCIIKVCTVTTMQGRIWQDFMAGTQGMPYLECPKCKSWILFEFDRHIFGEYFPEPKDRATQLVFDDSSKTTAEKTARLECPCCTKKISDKERIAALRNPRWVYRGQTISKKGKIKGVVTDSRENSWRWNQLHSPFTSLGLLAVDKRAAGESELKSQEFQLAKMALPYKEDITLQEFKRSILVNRCKDSSYSLGTVPEKAEFLILTADVQKRVVYWGVWGHNRAGDAWLVDLGVVDIIKKNSDHTPSKNAIRNALDEIKDLSKEGWSKSAAKEIMVPVLNGFDTGYRADVVDEWCLKSGKRFIPIKGLGKRNAEKMKVTGKSVFSIEHLLDVRRQKNGGFLFFIHVDESKARAQDSFLIEKDQPGYHNLPTNLLENHNYYTFHIISEQRESEFTSDKGLVVKWVVKKRNNHMLDVTGYGLALAEFHSRVLNYRESSPKKEAPDNEYETIPSDGINRNY